MSVTPSIGEIKPYSNVLKNNIYLSFNFIWVRSHLDLTVILLLHMNNKY